jgi:hypothetical protein
MSQPALADRLADVVSLEEWRMEHLSPQERGNLLCRRSARLPKAACRWESLLGANLSDPRDGAAILGRLGGHPIAVYGAPRGICMCSRGAACESAGKHPVGKGWQRAPFDPGQLDALLLERPGMSIGWKMGSQPNGWNLVTVDLDGDRSLLAPVEAQHGPLPRTLTAKSARGFHFIYRVPSDRKVGNRVALAPGVDVRGEGGQIVISPSKHASGAVYRWIDAREPAVLT